MAAMSSPGEEEHVRGQIGYTEGDRVLITGTERVGRCRFIGSVPFAQGVWAGIELPTPDGKNDGSVEGIRYFRCKPKHGLFVRAVSAVKEEANSTHGINEDSRHTHLSSGTPIKSASGISTPMKQQSIGGTPNSSYRDSGVLRRDSPTSSTPNTGRGKSTSIFDTVFHGSASKANASSSVRGELDPQQVEQIVHSDVFKKAISSLVSKHGNEIVDLKKRIQILEQQNRELKESLSKQEKLRPSMMKSLEQHQEAFKLISKLSSQVT